MEDYFIIKNLIVLINFIYHVSKLVKKNKANKMNRYEWCLSCVKLVGKVVGEVVGNALFLDE